MPADDPRPDVEGEHVLGAGGRRDVERVADHERRRFLSLERAELEHPGDLQPVHVARVDLAERAVAGIARIPAVHLPLGVRSGVGRGAHRRRRAGRQEGHRDQETRERPEALHRDLLG